MRPRGRICACGAVERIRVSGIENQQIAHGHAVDAQRLVVEVRRIPVVEQAVAAADGRAISPRRRREPEPRHQIELVVDVRLHFVAHADAERELVVQADVVLPVERRTGTD